MQNAWSIQEGELFTNLRICPGGAEITGRLLQEQRSWQTPFLSPIPQHKHMATCWKQHSINIHCQTYLHHACSPPPCLWLWGSSSFCQACLSPSTVDPLLQKIGTNLANNCLLTHTFCGALVLVVVGPPLGGPAHTLLKLSALTTQPCMDGPGLTILVAAACPL